MTHTCIGKLRQEDHQRLAWARQQKPISKPRRRELDYKICDPAVLFYQLEDYSSPGLLRGEGKKGSRKLGGDSKADILNTAV